MALQRKSAPEKKMLKLYSLILTKVLNNCNEKYTPLFLCAGARDERDERGEGDHK